jgi:hypothetical protein
MQHRNQFRCHIRHPNRLHYYLDAGLAAGAAAFSSLAGVLFAGAAAFLTSASFLTSAFAGAAGALAGSAAKADTAIDAIKATISLFILFSFKVDFELIPLCNNYS